MKRFLTLVLIFFFSTISAQTTIVLQPDALAGKDAVVWSSSANSNLGAAESNTIYTWTNSGNLGVKRAFLEFDLSAIPENATIISAGLSLYYNPTDPYEGFDFHTGNNDLLIRRALSSWEENTITWNNQPAATDLHQVILPPSTSSTQDYLDIDVTELVADMQDPGLEGNHGFLLSMLDEANYYKSLLFASSDHTNDLFHPRLEIMYFHNCPEFLPLNGTLTSGTYQAQHIASSGTLLSGTTVDFRGEVSVKLLPGFSAFSGSTFSARIESCSLPPVETVAAPASARPVQAIQVNAQGFAPSTLKIWPNPSREAVTISYYLAGTSSVDMKLMDLAGRQVTQLIKADRQESGAYQMVYHPQELEPGIYVLILQLDDQQITKKIVRAD